MYQNCIESINEIQRECWKRYNTKPEDNPNLNEWHKHSALELLRKCSESKFGMFQSAPALMQVQTLTSVPLSEEDFISNTLVLSVNHKVVLFDQGL